MKTSLYNILKARFLINDDAWKTGVLLFYNLTSYYHDCKYAKIWAKVLRSQRLQIK
jgi:hypothetical protein